jgi:hypothetical protein
LKNLFISLTVLALFASCNHDRKIIVEQKYVDSLLDNFTQPAVTTNEADLEFWKSRINPAHPGFTNELKYSGDLAARYGLKGDIHDLITADSILHLIIKTYNDKEPAPYLGLVSHSISQHKFNLADTFLQKAKQIGIKKYDDETHSFDVNFELGRYFLASENLNSFRSLSDYSYEFRLSKLEHYKGNLDSATAAMLQAASVAGNNPSLIAAALSNAADLEVHAGKPEDAYNTYKKSFASFSGDLHSILGIGWLALVHDENDTLASRIFRFVSTKTKSPDPILKLSLAAELRHDSADMRKYALQFVDLTKDSIYGTMYDKYLIELYTGILNDPAKAEAIAENEIQHRATPQTYAWYVWCLYFNNRKDEAYKVYEANVSGKPLEGIELYWMGKFMKGLGKGYNAHEFFKAAFKNRYDLSPSMTEDLTNNLKE